MPRNPKNPRRRRDKEQCSRCLKDCLAYHEVLESLQGHERHIEEKEPPVCNECIRADQAKWAEQAARVNGPRTWHGATGQQPRN